MKASILGAGDVSKISRFAKLSKEEVEKLINDVASLLAKKKYELVILPARGVPYLVAKAYKKAKGKKIIGLVPMHDKRFGIKHIKEYLGIEDKEVNIGSWYELNGEIAAYSEVAIVIGLSPGVMTEISMLKYHYKYLGCETKLIIFENTISARLHKEVEEDLGKNVYYVKSIDELEKLL